MLELLLLEIIVGKKNGLKEIRREKGCPKVIFLILLFTKNQLFVPFMFLDFLAHKKLHKHSPTNNVIVHNKTLSLQTKSITQILMIEKKLQQHNQFINKMKKKKKPRSALWS